MKTNRINFTLKDYQSGKYKVVTRDGKSVRIICTDFNNGRQSIVALISLPNGEESCTSFNTDGKYFNNGETSDCDLFLEETVFEDGDIVTNEKDIAIYKEIDKCYCGISEQGCLAIDAFFYYEVITRLATEAEKQRLFDALKKDGKRWNADKKCIEDIKKEYQFKPFDRVLVRDSDAYKWDIDLFKGMTMDGKYIGMSHICGQCIPYEGNESLYRTNKNPI